MGGLRHTGPIGLTFAVVVAAAPASAQPTHIVVRAIAKDAKFIGDSMGGVRITLSDAHSGRRLAQGSTTGATGDTKRMIVDPRIRGQPIASADAARFETTLDIDRPTLVRAEARGPLGKPGAQITVTSMMWLLPGQVVEGDGWMLEFPGLVVEPAWTVAPAGALTVSAKVTMMCGCPIEPGGHWDAAQYEVRAIVYDGERVLAETTLAPDGKPSDFAGVLALRKPGRYRLQVTAHNAVTGNTGVAETAIAGGTSTNPDPGARRP